jgi:hypothetical protein
VTKTIVVSPLGLSRRSSETKLRVSTYDRLQAVSRAANLLLEVTQLLSLHKNTIDLNHLLRIHFPDRPTITTVAITYQIIQIDYQH